MSDQNEDWWNAPGSASPPPPRDNLDVPRQDTDDAGRATDSEAPVADQPPPADATTVLPSSAAGAPPPPPPPASGQQPQQPPGYAPSPPPPAGQPTPAQAYSQPPAYGGQVPSAPQYGNQPQPYGQFPGPPPFPGQPDGQVPGAARKRSGGAIAGALVMLGGAILAAVGSLLPWLSFDGFGFGDPPNGFETYPFFGDDIDPLLWRNPGAYILGAYALVAVLAVIVLAAGKSTWTSVCGILAALIGGAISLAAIAAIADLVNTFRDLSVGGGIVLVALAAVVAFVGSLIVAIVR